MLICPHKHQNTDTAPRTAVQETVLSHITGLDCSLTMCYLCGLQRMLQLQNADCYNGTYFLKIIMIES